MHPRIPFFVIKVPNKKTRSAFCKACFDFVLLLSVVTDNKFLDFCGIHDIDFTVMVVIRKFSLNIISK